MLTQRSLKRLLVLSTVEDIGFLLLGLASASLLGYSGALIAAATHALAKALLFICLSAPEAEGALDTKHTGLANRYPVSAFGFLFGMLAMLGVPPTLGYIGRWRLYETALQIAPLLLAAFILSSVFALIAYTLALTRVWWGPAHDHIRYRSRRIQLTGRQQGAVRVAGRHRCAGGVAAGCRGMADTLAMLPLGETMKLWNRLMCYCRRRSPWIFHMNSGSCNGCDIELIASLTPRYDAEQLGVRLEGSPRHADILCVTGPVTHNAVNAIKTVYGQVCGPKAVVAIGSCPATTNVFIDSRTLDGPLNKHIPVDVFVPGCPPRPDAIIRGVAKAAGNPGGESREESARRVSHDAHRRAGMRLRTRGRSATGANACEVQP